MLDRPASDMFVLNYARAVDLGTAFHWSGGLPGFGLPVVGSTCKPFPLFDLRLGVRRGWIAASAMTSAEIQERAA